MLYNKKTILFFIMIGKKRVYVILEKNEKRYNKHVDENVFQKLKN